jgi:hypothetical protein
MPTHIASHRTVTTSRAAARLSQRFDGFTKWNAPVVSLVIAMPNERSLTLMPVMQRRVR